MIALLKFLDGPWEKVRDYLRTDLEHIEAAFNQRWGSSFDNTNQLVAGAIAGDPTPTTRYVANTGTDNAPTWDRVDLSNGVTSRLAFSHLVAATNPSKIVGRQSGTAGDFEELTPGPGLTIAGTVLQVSPASISGLISPGLDGLDGEDGLQGLPGPQGPMGLTGQVGPPGYDGDDGDSWWTFPMKDPIMSAVDLTSAPSTTAGTTIVNYYGTDDANFLGDPNAWLWVNVLGTPYKVPLYT